MSVSMREFWRSMEGKNHGVSDNAHFLLWLSNDWVINGLLLMSMMLQLVVVFGGAIRYRSSNKILALVVWLAYISADAVAISALGNMLRSSSIVILYQVWAPLLLLHLGGPDTMTAYSAADNELWLRHGLTMLFQISVAAYLIYLSALQVESKGERYVLVSGILVFIAGFYKYAERTLALRSASHSRIVSSAEAIAGSIDRRDYSEIGEEDYNFIIMGEKKFHEIDAYRRKSGNPDLEALLFTRPVTVQNVWEYEGRHITDNYILCASHAFFKIVKYSFVDLSFDKGVWKRTRRFFFGGHLSYEKVFKIAEMETKFMYDYLFSKSSSTAFSKWGEGMRLANICLLVVAAFLLFSGLQQNQKDTLGGQLMVTYILISVALSVESFQLCRIMVSDWAMVRIICEDVLQKHKSKHYSACSKLVRAFNRVIGTNLRKVVGGKYWQNQIHQHTLIETCLRSYRLIHMAQRLILNFPCLDFTTTWLIKACVAWDMKAKSMEDDFKLFIFDKLKENWNPEEAYEISLRRLWEEKRVVLGNLEMDLDEQHPGFKLRLHKEILCLHVATTICERLEERSSKNDTSVKTNFGFSGMLSRYCAYLLVSCPDIFPLHGDMAEMLYNEIVSDIVYTVQFLNHNVNNPTEKDLLSLILEGSHSTNFIIKVAGGVARELLEKQAEERWELLGNYWIGLLIYISVYSKSRFHAERLTFGGELITVVWVLLANMGFLVDPDPLSGL